MRRGEPATERAIVGLVLERERELAGLERLLGLDAVAAVKSLASDGVVVRHGERLWASPTTYRLYDLGLTVICEQVQRSQTSKPLGGSMSIERIFNCDGPGCDAHTRTASTFPGMSFLTVVEDAGPTLHFCSWDCVLRRAAEIPPVEAVAVGDD